jgi:hypothetical protein
MSTSLEQGDVFFFYRPRVGAETVRGIEDVQRFFLVLEPGRRWAPAQRPHRPQAPAAHRRTDRHERAWAVVVEVAADPSSSATRSSAAATKPAGGLGRRKRPQLPPSLRERFGGRRFIAANPPDLLDYEGVELVLIGAAEDASARRTDAGTMQPTRT